MKFLCLGYFDASKVDELSQTELDGVMRECPPHMETLYQTGRVIVDAGLDRESRCLRRVNGKVRVVDGPYIESKEMIGGVFLIEAHDMEDAIRLASLHPTTQVAAGEDLGWTVEIRPLHYFKKGEPSPIAPAGGK